MAEHKLTARELLAFLQTLDNLDIPVVLPGMVKGTFRDFARVRQDYVKITKGRRDGEATCVVVIEV